MIGQETVNIKYKPRCKSIIFLSVEILTMALPATFLWFYFLFQIDYNNNLALTLLILSGYGLLSLWWLSVVALRSVRRMVCREVPVLIKLGVGFGIIAAAVMMIFSAAVVKNNVMALWVFFCPLLLTLHLLFISKPNTDKYS